MDLFILILLRNILASGDTDAKIIDLGYAKSITNEKAQDMHTGCRLSAGEQKSF